MVQDPRFVTQGDDHPMPRKAVEEIEMTAKAHVEFDPTQMGVRVALMRTFGSETHVFRWQDPDVTVMTQGTSAPESAWLHLEDDDARALYEALADYFGHAGHDTRALRKDYDAERARVDKLIQHLTGGSRA